MSEKEGEKAAAAPRKKKHDHPAHGGAWKVAFADFMTSMFALFLVLWIISSTSASQKEAIAQYFQNPSVFKAGSSSPMDMGGVSPVKKVNEGGSTMREEQEAMEALDSTLSADSTLKSLGKQFQTRMTDKGLEIEVSDAEGLGTFELGSASINPKMLAALGQLAKAVGTLDNDLVVGGHTDSYAYSNGYSNWQLSADRANAVREYMSAHGVGATRVNAVIGNGDRDLKNPSNPYAPENRRVTLLVLKKGESVTPKDVAPKVDIKSSFSTPSGFSPFGEIVDKKTQPSKKDAEPSGKR